MKDCSVLFVANESFTVFKFVLPYARYLRDRGFQVEVACSHAEYKDAKSFVSEIRSAGFECHHIPFERELSPFRDFIAFCHLLLLLRKRRYAVVHSHTSKAGILSRVAAWIQGIRLIVHTTHDYAITDDMSSWKRQLFILLERITAKISDRIYFVSSAEMERGIKYGIVNSEKGLMTGPVGLNIEEFSPDRFSESERNKIKEKYGIKNDVVVVGCVSRLVPHKRVDLLIEAAALLCSQTD